MKHGAPRRPRPLSPAEVAARLDIDAATLERLAVLVERLAVWQRRINLVATRSLADVWRRHVLDSAQLHRHIPSAARVLIDLGSGAGFPGLVLAIMGGLRVHLVESNARKCAFLAEVNRLTEADATIHRCRIEALDPFVADVVTARALAPLDRLFAVARPFVGTATVCLFPKGKTVQGELTESTKNWMMETTSIDSLSDPSGVVLKVEGLSHRHA